MQGRFTQHKYHTWLRDVAVPWLRQNWEGRNDATRSLCYQHDGCTAHTTDLVKTILSISNVEPSNDTHVLQIIGFLGQEFNGKVWSLKARATLRRQGHPHWQRAWDFAPYSPDKALMDFFVWPQVAKKVGFPYGPWGNLETFLSGLIHKVHCHCRSRSIPRLHQTWGCCRRGSRQRGTSWSRSSSGTRPPA